ncbi:MAG: protease [Chloroflexota bacterium]
MAELDGKRIAVLAEAEYEDLELHYPLLRMREAGAEVTVVGSGSSPTYVGKHGLAVTVDTTADQVQAGQFDAIIIPGGWAPDRMRRYDSMVNLVRQAHDQGKIVAAICHAGWMLASAEIVQGHTVTSVRAIRDDLRHAGAEWVDREVVRDGNIITSRVPADLPAFCREIIRALAER